MQMGLIEFINCHSLKNDGLMHNPNQDLNNVKKKKIIHANYGSSTSFFKSKAYTTQMDRQMDKKRNATHN